ncbi:zinc ribbon domain-containing protein [Haloarcula argentinensis]|uniref:Zinc ribbon domain-containing protein n=1 Tax=Haloarcula argentinensis TaxID=43776 RepID=A0ABU2F1B5_HALAR|nr:zinc ribbon domain-containing protein [Haloarcula argentinensis]MDS0253840.1 zinc ribbon domain-containing protein [Haloarcula argentinensis]
MVSFVVYVVIGLTIQSILAMFVAGDASDRGLNSQFWGAFTFIFGIAGIVIYLLLRPSSDPDIIYVCQECRTENPEQNNFCSECGTELKTRQSEGKHQPDDETEKKGSMSIIEAVKSGFGMR